MRRSSRFGLFAFMGALVGLGVLCPVRSAWPNSLPASPWPGLTVIDEPLMHYVPEQARVRNQRPRERRPDLMLLLSRERYWREDGHLDVVVQLGSPADRAPAGELAVQICDAQGHPLWQQTLTPIPARDLIFYPPIPAALADGEEATLEVRWSGARNAPAQEVRSFRVAADRATPRAAEGRIPLRIANERGIHARGLPFTVGVPFPRGVLRESDQLQLVDAATGQALPLQVRETARWSKYGSLKWVLCDFTADLQGTARELHLVHGPQVRRVSRPGIDLQPVDGGFPQVEAGRLRLKEGLWFDTTGRGDYQPLLAEAALHGAFVEHGDGTVFRMPAETPYQVEEQGPEKLVLRREGWYREPGTERTFCQFITRYVIHRDSPLVRIFHTWIFTGDGNRETIANMGWQFPVAGEHTPKGFLTSFDPAGAWHDGDFLLQYDYEHFDIAAGDERQAFPGGRAAGVARAALPEARLYFGTRDFWQNYPSELEFREGSLFFHNWPRHNRPAGYTFDGELVTVSGPPASPSAARHAQYEPGRLTRSQWKLNLLQARFAHEGEHLNFRLPDVLGEDPIWSRSSRERTMSTYWEKGDVTSANAQGISRTEEMWLYVAHDQVSDAQATAVLAGLDDQTLRAVVDPAWMAASGAFYEIHPRDTQRFPEEERVYDLITRAPAQWIERLGLYGKWIHGDLAAWQPRLLRREPDLYRAFRKRHQGWPYSWIPYARSGQSDLLRLADAATRQNIDANYCHYVSPDVAAQTEKTHPRRLGRWHRSTLPWASRKNPTSRCYESQTDFLWHAWYLTGYHRAKDNALDWAVQTKQEEDLYSRGPIRVGDRISISLQKSYLDMYEATFDPWFLVAAHALAQGHLHRAASHSWTAHGAGANVEGVSHFWQTAERDFHRFTGSEAYRAYYLRYADFWGRHWGTPSWAGYLGAPMIEPNAYAWRLTGEDYHLRRIAKFLDTARIGVYEAPGEGPAYMLGHMTGGGQVSLFTGWYLQQFPLALAALAEVSEPVTPVYNVFFLRTDGERSLTVAIEKDAGKELALSWSAAALLVRLDPQTTASYRLIGPDGAEAASGVWSVVNRHALHLPAEAPAGVYRLQVSGTEELGLEVPISKSGAREVIEVAPGAPVTTLGGTHSRDAQYWFFVPEGVESFHVTVEPRRGELRRVSIWGPGGELAWDHQEVQEDLEGRRLRAEVTVRPEQAGQLWRLTLPGGGSFRMDEQIPPRYAVQPESWFMP